MDALDPEVRRDLRGLSKEGADWVAAHLVAAGALADEEPELAWRHARAARARGGRIGVVRETVGLVAYRAAEWAEAIGELRAARRMGGGPGHLAVMADCERALGHPERAIELSRSTEAEALDPEAVLELQIVVAGARADLGQVDVALAQIERLGLDKVEVHPRLAYAYADLLLKAGRRDDALGWFIRSANADLEEETDALERLAELGADDDLSAADDVSAVDDNPTPADDEGTPVTAGGEEDVAAEAVGTGLTEAGSAGTDMATSDDPDADGTDSGGTDSGGTDSGGTDSGGTDSGGTDSDASDSDVAGSGVANSDATEPEGTDSGVTDADVTDPDATEPDGAGLIPDAEFTDAPAADSEPADEDVKIIPTVLFSDEPQLGDR